MTRHIANFKVRLCQLAAGSVLLGAAALAAADPTLSIQANPNPAVQGDPLSLDILIAGIADLYAYQFTLNFDPALLQAVAVSEGPFLAGGGTTFADGGTINNTAGSISFVFNTLIGTVPGVSGGGLLAQISFTVQATGSAALGFGDVLFLDSQLATISVQSGSLALPVVAVVPEPAQWLMTGLGLVAVAGLGRRQVRKAATV